MKSADVPLVELCNFYLLTYKLRVTIGDSGFVVLLM